ncbi:MAG: insulinase family protein, partial [Candidatus Eremiobacteraeota bacterium]|nr:insulinase family protein [Candidatus Eremiobacteraeota bacterium]
MNVTRKLSAMAAAAILVAGAPRSAYAAAAIGVPSVQSADGATIVRQLDDAVSLAGVTVVVRAGLDRQTLKQNGLAALVAQTIIRTPVASGSSPLVPLEDAVAAHGGSIHFTVDPSDVRFYVESLSADAPVVLSLFRTALASPNFSAATVRDARAQLVDEIHRVQQVALQVGLDMLNAASSREANIGLPELGTPASLAQFFSRDASAFYRAYYRRGGCIVSAAGRLDAAASDMLNAIPNALPAGSTQPLSVELPQLRGATREIITHRDIASPWLIAQYPAPQVNSRDFGPMLVLSAFVRRTLADIAQVPGVVTPTFASRSVGTVYAYDRAPANLVLYVNGGLIGDPSRAFATALSVVSVLAATRLQGS